jgi:hypothetical protein
MTATPEDDRLRLAYYEALAAAELVLMIEDDAPQAVTPRIFETGQGRMALAFDGEDRLAAFTDGPAAYAALPGRALVSLLAGKGVGLGINMSDPASFLMPAEAVDWLAATLAAPVQEAGRPDSVTKPSLPAVLVAALDRRLARTEGLASQALVVSATWPEGRFGQLVVIVDATPGAEPALARAIGEAVTFSGEINGEVDIAFLAGGDPFVARIARLALRFDLPRSERPEPVVPGTDPENPPRLR